MPTRTMTRPHNLPNTLPALRLADLMDLPFGMLGLGEPVRGKPGRKPASSHTDLQSVGQDLRMAMIGPAFLLATLHTLNTLFAATTPHFAPHMMAGTGRGRQALATRAPWGSKTGRRRRRKAKTKE